MDYFKEVAMRAAMRAGAAVKGGFGGPLAIRSKGGEGVVTERDFLSERIIKEEIRSAFPDHGILSEESPEEKGRAPYRWVIDPLDGTTNYSHSFPHFSVSIALEENGKVVLGVVFDPLRDELFLAETGKGALLNGRTVQVSRIEKLGRSLLAMDFPKDLAAKDKNVFRRFAALSGKAQALRRAGSAALELCYVAAGRLEGYWNPGFHPWDAAAGWLILTEAGGSITDLKGGPFSLGSGECLATNGLVHEKVFKVLDAA